MDAVISLLEELTLWHWVGVGIVLLTIEVAVGTFDLLWVALAAFATALFALIVPESIGGWQGQLTWFGVVAIALVVMGRTVFKGLRQTVSTHPNLNDRMTGMIGRKGEAAGAFTQGRGRVRIGDTEWQAMLDDDEALALGEGVLVIGAQGTTLKVKRS